MTAEALRQLEKVQNLYMSDFRMGRSNERRLTAVFDEGVAGEPEQLLTGNSVIDGLLGGANVIEVRPGSRRFTLRFDEYVSFKITEEIFSRHEDTPAPASLFRENPSAVFLRHVKEWTIYEDYHEDRLHHYCVAALNHVLEVVTTVPPTVQMRILTEDDLRE
ncbi:hypothetical protein [Celeribacter indicus]|uniref:Uncharacterized protein n=1 Tax=Celeribacter indicus TaxID=1208324 RepID=A0A0B5DYR0_9RHOB|nr:hypothetical protein [Celeribacter indicus]AJE46320.1 hypothetical protein P73_1605 [Celeribacter indicus]SDW53274.1 hypothetical protein SAMN05443573_104156 [Celeribacter indicus]